MLTIILQTKSRDLIYHCPGQWSSVSISDFLNSMGNRTFGRLGMRLESAVIFCLANDIDSSRMLEYFHLSYAGLPLSLLFFPFLAWVGKPFIWEL